MKFASNANHEHTIVDRMQQKSFWSKNCVYAYVRHDSEMIVCCMCRQRMPFYQCIRRYYDDRCFCSFGCIIEAERNIDKLLQNDEQFHLDIFNLKCYKMDYDSDMDDSSISNQGGCSTQHNTTWKAVSLLQNYFQRLRIFVVVVFLDYFSCDNSSNMIDSHFGQDDSSDLTDESLRNGNTGKINDIQWLIDCLSAVWWIEICIFID